MAEVRRPLFWSLLHLQAMILVDKATNCGFELRFQQPGAEYNAKASNTH